MAQYFEPSTDTDANFANSVSGQANSFFLPSIYSKKVLNFLDVKKMEEADPYDIHLWKHFHSQPKCDDCILI